MGPDTQNQMSSGKAKMDLTCAILQTVCGGAELTLPRRHLIAIRDLFISTHKEGSTSSFWLMFSQETVFSYLPTEISKCRPQREGLTSVMIVSMVSPMAVQFTFSTNLTWRIQHTSSLTQ